MSERYGRKRSTAEERAAWVERFRGSGLSQREFVLRNGLSLTTLQSWLYSKERQSRRPAAVKFAELKLADTFQASNSGWAAEIEAGAIKVRVRPDVDPRWIGEMIHQLARAC
jgi:hypothetical protein